MKMYRELGVQTELEDKKCFASKMGFELNLESLGQILKVK